MKGKERIFLIVKNSYGAGFKLDKCIIRGYVKSDMYPSGLERTEKYKGCDILEVPEDCYIKLIDNEIEKAHHSVPVKEKSEDRDDDWER